jgi:hypothetical protein
MPYALCPMPYALYQIVPHVTLERLYVKGANMESFQQLRVYQLAEKISNEIWFIVKKWDDFAKDTMGK